MDDSTEAFAKIEECTSAFDAASKTFDPNGVDGEYLAYALRIVSKALQHEQTANWELEKRVNRGSAMSDQKATNQALLRIDRCFEHFNAARGAFEKPAADAFIEQTFE